MIYKANCKINIGLSILNRREDGFHNLSTIMYPAKNLYDLVEIVHGDSFSFSSSGLVIDCNDENNLCVKAYKLLKVNYPEIPPLQIHLHKTTPFGAGLGGGSSDATSVLLGINQFLGLEIAEKELVDYAAELGSDTPFFVRNTAQLCTGRGEIMEDVAIDLSQYHLTIVKPPFGISTKEAFSSITPNPNCFDLRKLSELPISQWKECVVNDFEEGLFKSHPLLAQLKEELYRAGAIYASMSGSGSALYAISSAKLSISSTFLEQGVEVFNG